MIEDVTPEVRKAFASAVCAYKPWHNHGVWNSNGQDAFWQLIRGGLEQGVFSMQSAADAFNASPRDIQNWADGKSLPERKVRIKVWKKLKQSLQL